MSLEALSRPRLWCSDEEKAGTAHLMNPVVSVAPDETLNLPLDLLPTTQEMHIEDTGELRLN